MDDGCTDSSEPIFELASECEQLFAQHVSRLKDEADANAAKAVGEFQQRFAAWAAFLGVFAAPERSLDRKLQRHAEVLDLVLRLLDVMKRNLTYLFEAHDFSNENDIEPTTSAPASPSRYRLRISVESLRGIEGAIERLHHLGGTIRSSSEASQAVKIVREPAPPPAMDFQRQKIPPIVRSHLGARSHQSMESKPTSLDSQEFKRRFSQKKDGSVKSKTRSILATQMAYPPQSEGSQMCDWCFSPLSEDELRGENWRKHVNEDFKPFVCISENCSEPLNRFATSRAWFSHMLETHGQHWHRQVHLPLWYICPLCNTQDTTYSRATDLTEHLLELHGDVFTEQQVQMIVHQSRLRAPRSQDTCPLCCLSMTDGQESGEGDQFVKKAIPHLSSQDDQVGENYKRIKTESGAKRPEQHNDPNFESTERTAPGAQALSSQHRPPLHFEAIAKHVASHLQSIMLLTLRMMVLEFAPELSANDESLSGGTDDGLSRFGSTRQASQHEIPEVEAMETPRTQGDSSVDINEPFLEESIPDCEHEVDWQDVMLSDEPSPEADLFLQQVIVSGAFQTKDRVPTPDDAAVNSSQSQRHHPEGGRDHPQRGVIISLPFRRDPSFTGHRSLLHNLVQRCSAQPSPIALVGEAGIGKTHLAIELAHRIVLSADASISWIQANTQSSIEEGFGIVSNLQRWQLNQVFQKMSDMRNGRWLIILDDVNENTLRLLLHSSNLLQSQIGTILVTTRHRKVGQRIAGSRHNVIEMDSMAVFDAVALLGQKLGRSENNSWRGPRSTSDLVKSLGLSPLAICRAASYIQVMPTPEERNRENSDGNNEKNEGDEEEDEGEALYIGHDAEYPGIEAELQRLPIDLATPGVGQWRERREKEEEKQKKARYIMARKFRKLLNSEQERTKLLEFEPPGSDGSGETLDSILTIWQTSFKAVRSERSSAADLLAQMSFFDRRGIPKWLLEPPRPTEQHDISSDIATLLDHCLISSNGTRDIFSMHGLMQLAVKRSINHSTRHTYEHLIIKRLEEEFPRDVYADWTTCEELFAHVQVAANRQPTGDYLLRYWTSLLYHAARFARAQSRYDVALKMAGRASRAQGDLRRVYMRVPRASSLIALIRMDQGLYNEAEDLLTHVADVCKDDSDVIDDTRRTTSMHNLACIYKLKGRWQEAEALLAEATDHRRETLGEDHPRTLSSMANLASTRKAQGHYHQAQSLLRRVFVAYTARLGPDHPRTLAIMNDLGSIYRLLGRLDGAEGYQKQAYESRKMIFGADHPDTLASMSGLASTYRLQGRLDEAEDLQEQTLEGRKRVLGSDHPSTLASMNNLALIFNDQGKHDAASKLQSQLVDACKEKLGPEHPHTLTSLNNLAMIWRNKARHGVTRWTMRDCVEARRRVLGPEHPYTVSSARILERWESEDDEMTDS
ncbi:hypothetical protein V8C44DRAFT_347549 [Trichoderma aethiopicum]